MAEAKKAAEVKPAASKPANLARAAESGDPAVHQLLAQRQTAVLNNDTAAVADVDRRLRDLGVE